MHTIKTYHVGLVACMVLFATGCSSSTPSDQARTDDNATAAETSGRPLDAFMLTIAEHRVVQPALLILRERCMARYGFDLREAGSPHSIDLAMPDYVNARGMFEVQDPSQGYAIVKSRATAESEKRNLENQEYINSLPPASDSYTLVYSGKYKRTSDKAIPGELAESVAGTAVYPTGCDGWAWDQIAPGEFSEGFSPIFREIYEASWEQAAADPRVVEVTVAWRSCMEASGYVYSSPDEPRANNENLGEAQLVTLARVDDSCRTSTNYASVRHDVLVEYDLAAIENNGSSLQSLRQQYDDQVRRAADVIGGASR